MTLPRRNHRRNLSSESTFLISSRDCSPIRRRNLSPAICYGGSLPRSTHSIPGRSPKRTLLNKQVIDEKNRSLAKSGEIYNKSSLTGQNEQPLNQRFQMSRNNYSGPSSLESGKTSSLVTSGPSSIDSGNKSLSLSRNSGHSSLDSSHGSATTVAHGSSVQGSPNHSARHKLIKSSGTSTPIVTTSTSTSGIKSTSFDDTASTAMPNSNSSGSITLQVTNNNNCTGLPNTKIFVQNSPVHTSITFENGKFMENSNVLVINNETTTNLKGDVIASRKSLLSPSSPLKQQNLLRRCEKQRAFGGNGKETFFSENDEAASETGDSLSMISETSPDSSLIPFADDDVIEIDSRRQNNVQSPESYKYTKHLEESMNNRKLSLQMGSSEKSGSAMVYNNMLKNHYNQQTNAITSPVIHNNNKMNTFSYENSTQAGSVGNLKVEKTSCNFLNSNPTINSDSLLNIFHKNIIANNQKDFHGIITVGSEPNLMSKQKINNCIRETTPDEKTPSSDVKQEPNGIYNFPSLTDLSFNFTSLHAQKILKGGTSIDTLVELDITKPINHKTNSNLSPTTTICTDFGMV